MLECAQERPENPSYTTIDFCSVTRFGKECGVPRTPPLPIPEKNVDRRNNVDRKFSKGMRYEVFLGGSCNPTTWRTDVAIPELETMGITYYNPQQVEDWRPELLEVEYHAKENATVMFFVIDNQTRGVSALIEVAHLAGSQRTLILVIQSYMQKNQMICGEEISQMEYEDLKTGQEVLQDLVKRHGIPVFHDIKEALRQTERILRENLTVQDLQEAPVHLSRENSLDPQAVFEKLDSENSGYITIQDACLGVKMLANGEVLVDDLKNFIEKSGSESNHLDDFKFDLQLFLELVTEFKRQQEEVMFSDSSSLSSSYGVVRDVYLGGTIENTCWRESIAIPKLKSDSLTYFIPKVSEGTKRFTDVEATAMGNSFIVLFVITSTARSIAAMAIAGHYIGKGANVVLCVQHLQDGATVGEETLSDSAVKDYNRGRMYLMDIAKRNSVPVFDEVSEVMSYVVRKCKERSSCV